MDIVREMIKINIKSIIQYRRSFVLTLIMQSASLLIYILLFKSIYEYSNVDQINGYGLKQMVWYFASANFVTACVLNFADYRISGKVISGNLAVDLLRPISLFKIELSNAIALRLIGVIFEFLLGFVLYSLFYFPDFLTASSSAKFLLLIPGSFAINFALNYLIGLLAFYIKNSNSLSQLKLFLIQFMGGAFIPLEFFPAIANRVFDFLPFKYVYYWPIQFFINADIAQGWAIFGVILSVQLVWCIALYFASKVLWKTVVRKFCGAGG